LLAVTIPRKPGSFKAFLPGHRKRAITSSITATTTDKQAHNFRLVYRPHPEQDRAANLVAMLWRSGFPVMDLGPTNELAKLHIRHLWSWPLRSGRDEWLYRFEFPDAPGALFNFPEQTRWALEAISMVSLPQPAAPAYARVGWFAGCQREERARVLKRG